MIGSGQWGNCPIWIAGRPYALDRCWTELFNDDRWQFLRVEPLAEPEIRFYMTRHAGGDWYEQFRTQAAGICSTR